MKSQNSILQSSISKQNTQQYLKNNLNQAVNYFGSSFCNPLPEQTYSRSLQLTFVNLTNQTLNLDKEYFYSGEWKTKWPIIKPKTVTHGIMVNAHALAGISGGLVLRIKNKAQNILLGFSDPLQGCYKHYGRFESDESKTSGLEAYSKIDNQQDKYNATKTYQLHIKSSDSCLADRCYVITLSYL